MNGQLVRKIPNASLLLKIVKKNVVKRIAVGNCVWLKRETKLLSMLPSVLQQTIALEKKNKKKFLKLSLLLTPNNASKKSVPRNGQRARKIPNAFQPFKTVRRNVAQKKVAGKCAWLRRVTRQLTMWQSVLQQIIVWEKKNKERFQQLLSLLTQNNAYKKNALISCKHAKKIRNVSQLSNNVKDNVKMIEIASTHA